MATPLPDPKSLLGALNALEQSLASFEGGRANQLFERSSSDTNVKAVVNGLGRVVSITIAETELTRTASALATKVKDVVNLAIADAYAGTRSAFAAFAGALGLPGLPAYGATAPNFADFVLTADSVETQILANNPCQSSKLFECVSGPVIAVMNARRQIVSLSFTSPLPASELYLAGQCVLAINCAIDTGTERPGENPTGVITTSHGFNDLVLYAKGQLKLNDRVVVKSLNCANWGIVANAGTTETNIGVEAKLGSLLSRAHVVVRDRGEVHGFIRTSDTLEKHNQTVIDGPVEEHATLVLPNLALNVQFPTVTQGTIELEPNQQQTAGPGFYNQLHPKSNAQVFLSSGTYYFNDLFLEPSSKVWLNASSGPIIIWVKNSFTFRGEFLDSAGGFPRVFVGYLGTSTAVVEKKYRGTLSAPNAKISISTIQSHEGAFHGKDIEVQPDTQICHRPFELRYEDLPGLVPPGGFPPPTVDLGFENVAGWSSPQALLTSVQNPVTQGARSLQITNVTGSTDVVSAKFSADLAPNGATRMIIDLWVPANQPNPTFFGNLNPRISVPSAGINDLSLGTLGLTGKPTNQFSQFEFPLPTNVRQALDGNASDVSLKLVHSINAGSGPWYIDNVRFLLPPAALSTLDPILSFENVSKWSSAQVSLSITTQFKTHLQNSLKVTTAPGWTQIVSVPFATGPLAAPLGKFRIDLRKPSTQPNPSWHGQFQLQIDVPSAGISNYTSVAVELTPLASNAFATIELALPANVLSVVNGEYSDMKLKLILNVTANSGPWHLDNIRFV
jgi:hypothetical protein